VQDMIRLWDTGNWVVALSDCWRESTKEHAWMCHRSCFNDMLPRAMTS
jgi:hypothetical protein